jgi:hypothetical protein
MNKRNLVVLLALGMVLANNAFASRATNLVLGSGDGGTVLGGSTGGGSFFYDDSRNMFYNPAYINDFKNFATVEKSNSPGSTAEGGFVTSVMNFNLGVWVNRGDYFEGSTYQDKTGANGAATNYSVTPVRPIEIFAGSDMGTFKWGLGLSYASHSGTTSVTQTGDSSDMNVTVGASVMNLEPFFKVKVKGTDPAGNQDFWNIGTRYRFGEWTPYAAYANAKNNNITALQEKTWGFGLGRSAKLAEGVKLNYALSYWNVTDTITGSDTKRQMLPIDISLEGDVNSWLTLRAGLGYHLVDKTQGTSAADNTTGRIGATIHAGKADVDFAAAKYAPSAGTETQAAGTGVDAQTLDIGSGFFTAMSVTYRW